MSLDLYKPLEEWYLHDPEGIHGLGHAARVLVWAQLIGYWMIEQGTVTDLEVVRWAAALHDIRRINDGRDLSHGERAANWICDNYQQIPCRLTELQLENIAYCCIWHVPHDNEAPAITSELICLKDADSLDRVRLSDLQIDYLRTSYATALPKSAQILYQLSLVKRTPDKWDAVRSAALQLDLWQ